MRSNPNDLAIAKQERKNLLPKAIEELWDNGWTTEGIASVTLSSHKEVCRLVDLYVIKKGV